MKFNREYWEGRYKTNATGWDLKAPSPPLRAYIDQLQHKDLNILIPGAGYGHEAQYLLNSGFKKVTVLDIAQDALDKIAEKCPDLPENQLKNIDFFTHEGQYDLILEHTFFCALSPTFREAYAIHMKKLLKPKGKLSGVLFDFKKTDDGPPFGGSIEEYKMLFEPHFNIKSLERCYNSVKPRAGRELFFIFENPKD